MSVSKEQEIAVANAYYDLQTIDEIVTDMDEGHKPNRELRHLNKMAARTMSMIVKAFPTLQLSDKYGGEKNK